MVWIFTLFGAAAAYLLYVALTWRLRLFGNVVGASMEPTLTEHMTVWLLPVRKPRRFDVVTVVHGDLKTGREEAEICKKATRRFHGTPLLKRVIALPGETVQIRGGAVYINGERLEADPLGGIRIHHPGIAGKPVTLGEDEYFCLGDNRNNSRDSRTLGPIKRARIVRRVVVPRARTKPSRVKGMVDRMMGVKSDEAARAVILERVRAARQTEAKAAKEGRHGH